LSSQSKGHSASHSESAGQRVHRLSSLGGLVVLAGLERVKKEVLLGGLLTLKAELQNATEQEVLGLAKLGHARFKDRVKEKRAYREEIERELIYLSLRQAEEILSRFGRFRTGEGSLREKIKELEKTLERF